uniref:Uncharacterized protein n=1 Tax=Anguilla anguilla TaxID=7936 RepID=A0A0E9UYX1_ANGAN
MDDLAFGPKRDNDGDQDGCDQDSYKVLPAV